MLLFHLVFLSCPKVLYHKYYITIILATCTLVRKKGVSPSPQNEGQAELHPSHFYYRSHTPCAWRCVSGAQGEH